MRSIDRCKQQSQGDRCRKPLGHEATDPHHEGQYTIWQSEKFRDEKFARVAPKRNRSLNRFVTMLGSGGSIRVPSKERAGFLSALDRAIRELRGAA